MTRSTCTFVGSALVVVALILSVVSPYAQGRAKVRVKLTRGLYRAQAFYKGLRTASKRVRAT